jgi:hypothetical protein
MKLGESVDCGFCSGFEEKCNQVINKAKVLYCRKHREKLIQSKRNARQEFASGNSSLREGEPIDLNKKKVAVREVSNHATYRIGSETIVAEGFKVKLLSPLKPTVQAANSKEIKSILNSNLPGSKHVRMLFGMEDQEVDPAQLQVFGPSLLKKMGGNPFLREELQLTPTKGSPRKRTVTESPGTPTQTPKKSKNADLSDSDLELEILAPRES